MTARLLLCDPQSLTRIGLKCVFDAESDIEVVGEAFTVVEAMNIAAEVHPDVILADFLLPGADGWELTLKIWSGIEESNAEAASDPRGMPRLLLMIAEWDDQILTALRAGASGVLVKSGEPDEFVRGIRSVLDGRQFLAAQVVHHVLDGLIGNHPSDDPVPTLTQRELEVLQLVAEGLSNLEIGRRLYLGEPTVKYHVSQMLRKLDVRDRLQAAVYAYRKGLAS